MLDWALIVLTIATGGGGSAEGGTDLALGEDMSTAEQALSIDEDALAEALGGAEAESRFAAEPQTPTGKFTTATEIKQIMELTRANWFAISAQPGNDFLYTTQIWSWRCGLLQMKVSINGAPMEEWPLPPCHENTNAPNAIIESDGLPFKMFAAGHVESVAVELLYDDLTTTSGSFSRQEILMP